MSLFRRKIKKLGETGENIAAKYLKKNGYSIIERNVKLGRYEVDIIAQQDDTIVFVEVKARRKAGIADPEDNVHATKRQHLRRAARIYMADKKRLEKHEPEDVYYRFDVVSVLVPDEGKPVVTLFQNAFDGG